MKREGPEEVLSCHPIGRARTPFREKRSAPRQPAAAVGVEGVIELFDDRSFEHALEDLEGFSHIWVLFWFDRNASWRPKVLPPRSSQRRGVFATRSPHRPNPIGMSVLRLDRVEGLVLRVRDVDLLDGTPVLDIKPYVPYADSVPQASVGWLEHGVAEPPQASLHSSPPLALAPADPDPGYRVEWCGDAEEQLAYLAEHHGVLLRTPAEAVLRIGPQPHPYRRIKRVGDSLELSLKDWRVAFCIIDRSVRVLSIRTGYRLAQLATAEENSPLFAHLSFVRRFTR